MTPEKPGEGHFIHPPQIPSVSPDTTDTPLLPSLHELNVLTQIAPQEPAGAENIRAIAQKIARHNDIVRSFNVDDLTHELSATPALRLANTPRTNHILVVHQGGSKETGIKYLNNLLSIEDTNNIIHKRHEVVRTALSKMNVAITNQLIADDHHRTDTYSISNAEARQLTVPPQQLDLPLDEATPGLPSIIWSRTISTPTTNRELKELDKAIKSAEKELQIFLLQQIEKAEQIALQATPPDTQKARALRFWLDHHYHSQLTLSFGISEDISTDPNDPKGFEERLAANDIALMTARIHEQRREIHHSPVEHREFMGISFDAIGMITDMYRCVYNLTHELEPTPLAKYFDKKSDGNIHLKLAIIELLRKGKAGAFEEHIPDENVRKIIKMYYRVINRFDCIKPWPDHRAWQKDIQEKRMAIASFDPIVLRKQLLKNPKPIADMGEAQFHAEAAKIPHGIYIMCDQIGMGNENIDSFQEIFWQTWRDIHHTLTNIQVQPSIKYRDNQLSIKDEKLEQIKDILKKSTAHAGKAVTEKFYTNAAIARAKLQAYLHRHNISDELTSAAYMGDEYIAVIPLTHTPEWNNGEIVHYSNDDLLHTLASIKDATGYRISATYKGPYSNAATQYPAFQIDPNITEHFRSLDALDYGIKYAKACEESGFADVICVQQPSGALAGVIKTDDGKILFTKVVNLVVNIAQDLHETGKTHNTDLVNALLALQTTE